LLRFFFFCVWQELERVEGLLRAERQVGADEEEEGGEEEEQEEVEQEVEYCEEDNEEEEEEGGGVDRYGISTSSPAHSMIGAEEDGGYLSYGAGEGEGGDHSGLNPEDLAVFERFADLEEEEEQYEDDHNFSQ
jgi:hypothetical protein